MKLNRRQFLQFAAASAAASGVAACVAPPPGPAAPAAEAPPTEAAAPAAAPASQQVKLRLMTWSAGEELELHKKAFQAYVDKTPGLEVEVSAVAMSDYYTKLQTEAAGGAAADLIGIGEAYTTRWAASNVLLSLQPFIDQDASFERDDFFPNVLENFTYQNNVYVLPKDYVTFGLYYNKTLFDQAGMDVPDDTWDWTPEGTGRYDAAAKQLTLTEGNRITQYGTMAGGFWGYYFPRVWENGGRYLNDERTDCLMDSAEAVAAIQWLSDMINKWQVAPTAETEAGGLNFASGKIAMMPQGSYMVPGLLNAEFEWAVAPHPLGPTGERRSIMFSSGYGIYSGSPNKEAAWGLAVHMTREGSEMLAITGFSVPSRKSIAGKPGLYLNDQTIPHNVQVFVDAASYMGLHEITPTWLQEEQILTEQMSLIMAGEQTAAEGMKVAAERVEAVLKGA